MSPKLLLILVGEPDPNQLLAGSFPEAKFLHVSESRSLPTWNRNAAKYPVAGLINLPIQTTADVETVRAFMGDVKESGIDLFYVVRPNEHLESSALHLFGSTTGAKLKAQAWYVSVAKQIARPLPRSLRGRIRSGLSSLARRVVDRKSDKAVAQDTAPRSNTQSGRRPALIQGEATAWRPPVTTQFRDLIERVETFFPHPTSIHVAISNKCNLSCVMCPYHSPKYKAAHTTGYFDTYKGLSSEAFEKVAVYAGQNGISLQFGQIEEPLLHPRIMDFISRAKAAGVPHVHVTTNGTPLTRDVADKLAKSGVDSVMFSLDAANPDTYRKIRGAKLEVVEKGIDYFLPKARKAGVRTFVSFIRQPQSNHEREEFLHKWRSKGIDSVTFYVLSEHEISTGEMIRTENLRLEDVRYPCAAPWVQAVVMPDATVGLCCKTMTDIGWRVTCVGDLNTQDFTSIWTGDAYGRARLELLRNEFSEFETCRNCQIWSATTYEQDNGPGFRRDFNETMETYTFLGIPKLVHAERPD